MKKYIRPPNVLKNKERERESLQATQHNSKHGGYGKSAIGIVMPNQIASIPQKKSIAAEDCEVCCTQSHSFREPALVTKPLSDAQCRRIRLQCSRFTHKRQNRPNLSYRLHFLARISNTQMEKQRELQMNSPICILIA